jgi:hypothetical protein
MYNDGGYYKKGCLLVLEGSFLLVSSGHLSIKRTKNAGFDYENAK